MTVLFCDLVGSTALSEQLDPEEWREVVVLTNKPVPPLLNGLMVTSHNIYGDGLLVYFGYPVAHEDDAARAVRTGLEIIAAIQKKVPSPLVGNDAQLSHYPFAILGEAETKSRRAFVAGKLAARAAASRRRQQQAFNCGQGGHRGAMRIV